MLELRDNLHRQNVPPIDSTAVYNESHSQLQELSNPAEVRDFFSKLREAENWAASLPAPAFVGGCWRTREVDDQVPMRSGFVQWECVIGMQQQDFQPCPPPTDARPSARRILCSRLGEDLMAATTW